MARLIREICFNTQPPEGGCFGDVRHVAGGQVSTHSRPKAAAMRRAVSLRASMFQHTAARRRLCRCQSREYLGGVFQHTAARRRLL